MALLLKKDLNQKDQTQAIKTIDQTKTNTGTTSQSSDAESEYGLNLNFAEQSRCDLIYGESGVGKTENLGLAALYVWEKYGKISRLVSADGGGWKPLQPYIDLGIIQPLSINAVKTPLKIMMALARGYWPVQRGDKRVYIPIDQATIDGDEINGIPGVGCELFEGLTSWADAIMLSLLRRKDIHIPETPKESFVKDGEEYWGFSGRAHYGFVQNRVQEVVSLINGLPYQKLVMTALEEKGTDPETGESCYGPKIIGKASTGRAPSWFGDCIHLEAVKSNELIDDKRDDYKKTVEGGIRKRLIRAYLMNHPDPTTGIMYKAKGRTSAWMSGKADPFFDVIINEKEQKGLNYIYETEDRLADEASAAIKAKLKRPAPVELYSVKGKSQISVPEIAQGLKEIEDNTQQINANDE